MHLHLGQHLPNPDSERTCSAFFCRPLPSVVVPCLSTALATILGHLKAVFPPAAACLAAQGNAANRPAPGAPAVAGDTWLDEEDEEDEGDVACWLEDHILNLDL